MAKVISSKVAIEKATAKMKTARKSLKQAKKTMKTAMAFLKGAQAAAAAEAAAEKDELRPCRLCLVRCRFLSGDRLCEPCWNAFVLER